MLAVFGRRFNRALPDGPRNFHLTSTYGTHAARRARKAGPVTNGDGVLRSAKAVAEETGAAA